MNAPLPVLPDDLALVRDTYGAFKLATVEFAEACQAAMRNGRKIREIASAAGCGKSTVGYVLQAVHTVDTADMTQGDLDEAMSKVRSKPKPPPDPVKPVEPISGSEDSNPNPSTAQGVKATEDGSLDHIEGVLDGEIVGDDFPLASPGDYKSSGPSEAAINTEFARAANCLLRASESDPVYTFQVDFFMKTVRQLASKGWFVSEEVSSGSVTDVPLDSGSLKPGQVVDLLRTLSVATPSQLEAAFITLGDRDIIKLFATAPLDALVRIGV